MILRKNDEVILGCAIRYALGRRTYITSVVSNYIIDNIDGIDWHLAGVMIKDIEACEDYGDECDKQAWMRALAVLKEKYDRDSKY